MATNTKNYLKKLIKIECDELVICPNLTIAYLKDVEELTKLIDLDQGVYYVDSSGWIYLFMEDTCLVVRK